MDRASRPINVTLYQIITFCAVLLGAAPVMAESGKLKVVATFSILADMTRQIAGDGAEVTALVPPNGDAHVYRATPGDAKTLKDAALIITNGLGFEAFMPRLIKSSGTKAVTVTATQGLKPLEQKDGDDHGHAHDHGKADPHAWQSLEAAKTYIANIRDGLIKADPARADAYRRNAETYLAEIDTTRKEIIAALAAIPQDKRIIATTHDALAYFAKENGFTLASVQGVSTDAEPSAKDVARIIRTIRNAKAQAVFVENMTNPKLMSEIARETGAKIGGTLFSDSLSDEKGSAPTYIRMMKHNAKALAEALKP